MMLRPNLILHVVDDPQHYYWGTAFADDITRSLSVPSLGRSTFAPTHEQIARSGAVFVAAHSAAPLCMPSRWSMLTGRYPSAGTAVRSSAVSFNMRPLTNWSLAHHLLRLGYTTGFAGKWHVSSIHAGSLLPLGLASVSAARRASAYPAMQDEVRRAGFQYADGVLMNNVDLLWANGSHLPEWVISKAIAFVRGTHASTRRTSGARGDHAARGHRDDPPFFLCVAQTLEHSPFAPGLCSTLSPCVDVHRILP